MKTAIAKAMGLAVTGLLACAIPASAESIQSGAKQGAATGNRVAGPVGAVVGGTVGGVTGGVVGGVKGMFGIPQRADKPARHKTHNAQN